MKNNFMSTQTHSIIDQKHKIISTILNIIFLIFFYRVVIAKHSIEPLAFFFTLLVISTIIFLKPHKDHIPKYSFFVVITPTIILFMQYLINKIPTQETIVEVTNQQILHMYNINYVYSTVFILIPFILINIKYKYSSFFNIISLSNILYVFFNTYLIVYLNLNRSTLTNHINSIINYDNVSSILNILTFIYSCHLYSINKKYHGIFLFIISSIAIFINISHGTRGTWLVFPFLVLFTLWIYRKTCQLYIFSICSLLPLVFTYFYIKKGDISDRLFQAYNDVNLMLNNSSEATSIGSRIEMWILSIDNFRDSPIIGIGSFNVAKELCDLSHQGILAGECLTHMHNIYFQELASHGLIGLLSLLFLFIYPSILFFKKLINRPTKIEQFLSLSGLYTIFTVMVCGLTDFYFITEIATSLYSLLVLSILAFLSIESIKPEAKIKDNL